jgi:hypothetical protein
MSNNKNILETYDERNYDRLRQKHRHAIRTTKTEKDQAIGGSPNNFKKIIKGEIQCFFFIDKTEIVGSSRLRR